MAVPDTGFEQAWIAAGTHLRSLVRHGFAALVHYSMIPLAPVALRYWQLCYWRDLDALHDAARRQSGTAHAALEEGDARGACGELFGELISGAPLHAVLAPRSGAWSSAIGPIMAGSCRREWIEPLFGRIYQDRPINRSLGTTKASYS